MATARKPRGARKSIHQAGWIVFEGSFAARPCSVLDLSDTGAKITAKDPIPVHTTLRLAFSRDVRGGRPCEVVWQRGKSFGVKFI